MSYRLLDWTVLITVAILFHKGSCNCHQFFTILSQTFEPPIYALQTLDPDELPYYRLLNITDDEFNNCYISFSCHDEDDPECDNIIDKGSSFIPTEYSPVLLHNNVAANNDHNFPLSAITSETYGTESIIPSDKATTTEPIETFLGKNTTQIYNTQTKSSNNYTTATDTIFLTDPSTEIYNTETKGLSYKTNAIESTGTRDATDTITEKYSVETKFPSVNAAATESTKTTRLSETTTVTYSTETKSPANNITATDSTDTTSGNATTTETYSTETKSPNVNTSVIDSTESTHFSETSTKINSTEIISIYTIKKTSLRDATTETYNAGTKSPGYNTIAKDSMETTPANVITTETYGREMNPLSYFNTTTANSTEMNSLSDNTTEMNSIDTKSTYENITGTDGKATTVYCDITTETVSRGTAFSPGDTVDKTKTSLLRNMDNVTNPTNITSADEPANSTALIALCTVASLCAVLITVYFIAKKALVLGQRGSYRTGEEPER